MKNIILSLFVLTSISLSAQDWSTDVYKYGEEYPGYVIEANGNKIEGFIEYRNRYSMQNEVVFFKTKGDKKSKLKFDTGDLKEYKVADKLYHCINYSGGLLSKPIKANLLVTDGCIREYVWYNRAENYTTMQKLQGESDEDFNKRLYPPTTIYYKEGDEKPVETSYFAMKFTSKMAEYVAKDKELAAKVTAGEKGYKMLNILDIIAEYNKNCEAK